MYPGQGKALDPRLCGNKAENYGSHYIVILNAGLVDGRLSVSRETRLD